MAEHLLVPAPQGLAATVIAVTGLPLPAPERETVALLGGTTPPVDGDEPLVVAVAGAGDESRCVLGRTGDGRVGHVDWFVWAGAPADRLRAAYDELVATLPLSADPEHPTTPASWRGTSETHAVEVYLHAGEHDLRKGSQCVQVNVSGLASGA